MEGIDCRSIVVPADDQTCGASIRVDTFMASGHGSRAPVASHVAAALVGMPMSFAAELGNAADEDGACSPLMLMSVLGIFGGFAPQA